VLTSSQYRFFLFLALSLACMAARLPHSAEATAQRVACCGPIAPAGAHLLQKLDSMHVESLWLANEHVNWETGEPDRGANYEGPGNHTHCSAFAAAAAQRLGVYLLHPPEHGQQLLANAQAVWLASDAGRQRGWKRVSSMKSAQRLANEGSLVLALFQNPDKHVPGHIAIVRPSEKSEKKLNEDGPDVIQAGEHNHTKIIVRIAFENHPGAWPDGILYYTHALSR
jgi:hypothetical protein